MTTMNISQTETELQIIKKIMEDSRKIIVDNGWHYIFWGVVVTIALIANYFMALYRVSVNYQGMLWFAMMTGAWITEAIIEKRISRKKGSSTFAGRLLGSLWFASGISMFIFGFIGAITKAYNPIFICPVISTVLGVAYITSGAIQQTRWLQFLAVGWWGGAIFMFMYPTIHTLLIYAFMVIFLQTIPGIILFRKWKVSGKTV